MLMGGLAAAAGLANDIYNIAHAFLGHRKGGLAAATVIGCGGFGAVCGSGVATTATFGRVAMPEMLARGYPSSLAAGSIAAGGTLGIIVPPSTIMVLYAILSEQFVVQLFTAAIIPAILAIVFYLIAVRVSVIGAPEMGASEPLPWRERFAALRQGWGVIVLSVVVLGGIYTGIFTVNEAAAVGVVVAFVFLIARRGFNLHELSRILIDSASSTAMIYVMVFGATIFSYFMAVTGAPGAMVEFITGLGLPNWGVVAMLLLLYIFLGAFFDEVAAMIVTLPFVIPIIQHLGYDLVWWGIINVIVIEIGMISPPIGINVMVLNAMRRDVSLGTIYRGILPFFLADLVRLGVLAFFPALTLWLPSVLM